MKRILFTSRHQHLDLQQNNFVCSVIRLFMETLDKVMSMWQLKRNSMCIKMQKLAWLFAVCQVSIQLLLSSVFGIGFSYVCFIIVVEALSAWQTMFTCIDVFTIQDNLKKTDCIHILIDFRLYVSLKLRCLFRFTYMFFSDSFKHLGIVRLTFWLFTFI